MAEPTPSGNQIASSEPRLAQQETALATNPKGTQDSTAPKTEDDQGIVSKVTESATAAATGVKDSVFSMFGGGGPKTAKKVDDDDKDEPSGSSKAKKAEDDEDVCAIHEKHTQVLQLTPLAGESRGGRG